MHRLAVILTILVCLTATPIPKLVGQTKPNQQPAFSKPSAKEIVDTYIHRLGGYEVLESISTARVRYSASKSDQPFQYEILIAPGKYYSFSRYANGRTFERGINDGVSWTCTNGEFRQLFGKELEGIIGRHQYVSPPTRWIENCKSIEFKSIVTIDGQKTYKLHFVHKDDREADKYFDVETGLLVRSTSIETHGSHTNQVIREYSDYQPFGDLVIPIKRTIESHGRRYLYNVESYEVDIKIPKGTFDLPKSIVREN